MKGRKAAFSTERRPTDNVSMPLILDLVGPFVVHFCDGVGRIHAPLCSDHHANILTDKDDFSLYGLDAPEPVCGYDCGYVYRFEDSNAPRGANRYTYESEQNLLSVSCDMRKDLDSKCHLVFEIPYPDRILGLHPEMIWIHRNGATHWVKHPDLPKEVSVAQRNMVWSRRARGLRFIYDYCVGDPVIVVVTQPEAPCPQAKAPDKIKVDAMSLGIKPPHYQMTLRFASNATTPDDHHQDAYSCFHSMRCLVPSLSDWRVDFETTPPLPTSDYISGHHPVDCGAAVLVVEQPE